MWYQRHLGLGNISEVLHVTFQRQFQPHSLKNKPARSDQMGNFTSSLTGHAFGVLEKKTAKDLRMSVKVTSFTIYNHISLVKQ